MQMELTEDRVRGNGARKAASAIAHLGRNGEGALFANDHVLEALVPALDDLASTELEAQRVTTVVACIKLLAAIVGKSATVVPT